MRVVRTYPVPHPETLRGRARVEDEIDRCYIYDYDNSSLVDFNDDLLILEWDIALSRADLMNIIVDCRGSDRVKAVPYRLYFESDPRIPTTGVWSSQKILDPTTLLSQWVRTGDSHCDMFGFGCTYIPGELLRAFRDAGGYQTGDQRMTDTNFSLWHYRKVGRPVELLWEYHPVHLHFDVDYAIREAMTWNLT